MTRAEEATNKAYPSHIEIITDIVGTQEDLRGFARDVFQEGYEQAEEDTIDQACQWLFSHLPILVDYYNDDIHEKIDRSDFIKMFRKEMTEIEL